jgi:two-component system, OmpR family, KDP operon response regulator KdpE
MLKVLVVDDEPQIIRALGINMQARGLSMIAAATGAEGLEMAATKNPDVVVVDLGLPDMRGVDVIEAIRRWSRVPIIVLSGRSDSVQKVEALNRGADDYVTKPFNIEEFFARIRAVTRRVESPLEQPIVHIGQWNVDIARRVITGNGDVAAKVRLTPTEWQVLEILVQNEGKLVTKQQLLAGIGGKGFEREQGYLRLYLSQLRQKLESNPASPEHFLTETGMGYRFRSNQPLSDATSSM